MNISKEMNYNSSLEQIIMPEYGRNVQQLVYHARTITDPRERQAFFDEIVNMILRLYPQSKNVEDYRDKLWKHIFKIADYQLEGVLPPNGMIPTPEDEVVRPERVPYPTRETRFRHYGLNVQELIKKAIAMEDGPKREGFIQTIGAYMKLAYRTWNKEHYVTDESIKSDLFTLSKGLLSLDEASSIDAYAGVGTTSTKRRPTTTRDGGGNGNGNSSSSRSSSRPSNKPTSVLRTRKRR